MTSSIREFNEVSDFKDLHKGEAVAILLNGPSLMENIPYLPKHKIGVNASIYHVYADYHIAMDITTFWKMCHPDYKHRPKWVFSHKFFYTNGRECSRPPIFNYVDMRASMCSMWSNDLEKVIYTGRVSLWPALQLANYMGFDPIILVGFDLTGTHIKGHIYEDEPMMELSARKQLYLMKRIANYYQPQGIIKATILNANPASRCKSFPFINLKER